MVRNRYAVLSTPAAIAAAVGVLFVTAAIGVTVWGLNVVAEIPEFRDDHAAAETTLLYDAEDGVLGRLFVQDRVWKAFDDIPEIVANAFIAVEDRNFRRHRGVDLRGIGRAFVQNILHSRIVEGGSTITQQLARHLFLGREQTLARKVQEVYLARRIEQSHSKAEILERYLNEIYLGSGAYGVEAASQLYFGKSVSEVGLAEAALLAALPRSPEFYSPVNNPVGARSRRDLVLGLMAEQGYATPDAAAEAAESAVPTPSPRTVSALGEDRAHHFIKHVRDALIDEYGSEKVFTGGLRVYTTLDPDKQTEAENAIDDAFTRAVIPDIEVEEIDGRPTEQPQAALVSLNAKTGEILAMVGGRSTDSFNRATQATRQPGSAFKPFVYATAIMNGRYPGTVVADAPLVESIDDRAVAWPRNYDNVYRGPVTYREALAMSINTAAVRVIDETGVERVAEHLLRYGFSTLTERDGREHHLALALGGVERGVTPLEMTAAYGVFIDGKRGPEPFAIRKVETADGEVLYRHNDNDNDNDNDDNDNDDTADPRILPEAVAYIMDDMLAHAVTDGTGWRAALEGHRVAGKTGTSDRNVDAWFVGYTGDLVTTVWFGEDDGTPMRYVYTDDGYEHTDDLLEFDFRVDSIHSSIVWGRYMESITVEESDRIERPAEIIEVEIDPVTGLAASEHAPVVVPEIMVDPDAGVIKLPSPIPDEPSILEPGFETMLDGEAWSESEPLRTEEFWAPIRSSEIDASTGLLATRWTVFRHEARFIEGSRYKLGPAEYTVHNAKTPDDEPFEGVYRVDENTPVYKLDPSTGLPRDPEGPAYRTVPAFPCLAHCCRPPFPIDRSVVRPNWCITDTANTDH
ncbi:MAG: PBP1A family penicillin-binding protein [Spirochaetaceae bacterium]|nr:MAG: PBP1A family penicillin-binding protein [Spirochaetaceae bacterium]